MRFWIREERPGGGCCIIRKKSYSFVHPFFFYQGRGAALASPPPSLPQHASLHKSQTTYFPKNPRALLSLPLLLVGFVRYIPPLNETSSSARDTCLCAAAVYELFSPRALSLPGCRCAELVRTVG